MAVPVAWELVTAVDVDGPGTANEGPGVGAGAVAGAGAGAATVGAAAVVGFRARTSALHCSRKDSSSGLDSVVDIFGG